MSKNSMYVKLWHQRHSNPNGIVYLIQNIFTGEQYIGSTKQPLKKRWWQHVAEANAGSAILALYDNIRRYGKEMFEVSIAYECLPGEDIKEREIEYIQDINPELNKNHKII